MQKRAVLLVMLTAIAAVFVWLASAGRPQSESAGIPMAEDLTRGEEGASGEELVDLAPIGHATTHSSGADSGRPGNGDDRVAAMASSGDAPAPLVLPSRLQWVDELTMEPAPFVFFSITDEKGKEYSGKSDKDGWCDVPPWMTPGPVQVTVIIGARRSSLSNLGAEFRQYVLATAEGRDECVWPFPASRLVPLRVSVDAQDASRIDLFDLEAWISCSSTKGSTKADWVERRLVPQPSIAGIEASLFLGATHVIGLLTTSPKCWQHEKAATPMEGRALLLVTVVDGTTYVGETVIADFPRLGELPIELTMRPQLAAHLPSEEMLARYGPEEAFQQEEIARIAAEKARPVYRLEGLLQSNSGAYQGQVAIRANPAERNKEGGHDLRQQWISAEWKEVSPGRFEAPFTLDRLDGGAYWVYFVPQDGIAVSERKVSIDTMASDLDPLVVTILD